MSIWSSFANIPDLYDGDYGEDDLIGSELDLAETGMRDGDRIRLWLSVPAHNVDATVSLRRRQVEELRDQLTGWLEDTYPTELKDLTFPELMERLRPKVDAARDYNVAVGVTAEEWLEVCRRCDWDPDRRDARLFGMPVQIV